MRGHNITICSFWNSLLDVVIAVVAVGIIDVIRHGLEMVVVVPVVILAAVILVLVQPAPHDVANGVDRLGEAGEGVRHGLEAVQWIRVEWVHLV